MGNTVIRKFDFLRRCIISSIAAKTFYRTWLYYE